MEKFQMVSDGDNIRKTAENILENLYPNFKILIFIGKMFHLLQLTKIGRELLIFITIKRNMKKNLPYIFAVGTYSSLF